MMIILIWVFPASSQRSYAPREATGESAFELTIRNVKQTKDRILEFDLYLLDTDASDNFELATVQAGILLSSAIFEGGKISVSVVAGTSTLNSLQNPSITGLVSPLNGYPGLSLVRLASRMAPGYGNGTIISGVGQGDRIARLRLTSTVPFAANSTPNLAFTSSLALYPVYATRVAQYISDENVQLIVIPAGNALVLNNPVLNPVKPNIAASEFKDGSSFKPEASNSPGIRVFSYDKTVVIEKPNDLTGVVSIYDLTGREISLHLLPAQFRTLIPVRADCGTFIVKVVTVNATVNQKVFIR